MPSKADGADPIMIENLNELYCRVYTRECTLAYLIHAIMPSSFTLSAADFSLFLSVCVLVVLRLVIIAGSAPTSLGLINFQRTRTFGFGVYSEIYGFFFFLL
jgi:hypothetical protein